MDIVCLGEVLIDMFPAEVGRELVAVSAFRPVPGGAPANVAVAARRLGARSAFIGKVGDDAFGHHLAAILAQEGVVVDGMRYDPEARTGLAFIAMPDENTADILFYRNPGADMRLKPEELDLGLLGGTRSLHFGSLSLIQEPSRSATLAAVETASAAGALISFDVNYRADLWSKQAAQERVLATIPAVNLLKVNEVEVGLLTGKDGFHQGDSEALGVACEALLALGPALVVVTLGPDGCYFRLPGAGAWIPPFQVKTVDATGCGDAFVAGLLTRLLHRGEWKAELTPERMVAVLRFANAVGALTATRQGVIPSLPAAAEVEDFLAARDHGSG